jgi:ABC-type bacteriocin/lantibiotic exporter with double-glycine peptidase domain
MVLASRGKHPSEGELRQLCKTTLDGTTAKAAVDASIQLGFKRSAIKNLSSLNELATCYYPIVYLSGHAVVVTRITAKRVYVLDPASELIDSIDAGEFDVRWRTQLRLTILVK